MVPPILRSNPCLVVGMPVFLATLVLKPLMPIARFNENDNPGIFISLFVESNKVVIYDMMNGKNNGIISILLSCNRSFHTQH